MIPIAPRSIPASAPTSLRDLLVQLDSIESTVLRHNEAILRTTPRHQAWISGNGREMRDRRLVSLRPSIGLWAHVRAGNTVTEAEIREAADTLHASLVKAKTRSAP